MRVESRLDYLYFNWAFVERDLPLARMSNGAVTRYFWGVGERLASLLRWRPRAPDEEQFEALVRDGAATFLFLERPRGGEAEQIEYSQKYLYRLVRAQREIEEPVQVVGLTLLWERRPEPRGASLVGEVFGTARSPGLLRKVFGVVPTLWRSFFNLGEPLVRISAEVDLPAFLAEYPNAGSADASELLRERLLDGIERERRLILGPTGKAPRQMAEDVVRAPEVEATMERLVDEGGEDAGELRAKARRFFDEIAANQSLFVVKLFSVVLGIVWYWIYDGLEVDEEGLDRVKEEGREKSLILVPSHKSHVDYLIISYIFYHYGLMPPHIAAGVNLSFFPVGPLFRRAGAFFIRRSFKGEDLYPVVFEEYLVELMRERYPIEFFIEGTRSRTGKLVKPRYGMLEMIARAVATGRVEGVSVVPISVGYETIVESGSYTREVRGEEKKKEGLGELLKAPRFLASRYGRLNVQFGEPIDLGEYLKRYGFEAPEVGEPGELDALTVRLGHRINHEINAATAVTPTALAATVLLNAKGRRIARERIAREVGFVLKFLRQPERDARLSRTLEAALGEERGVRGALELAGEGEPAARASVERVESEDRMGRAVASALDEALELFEEKDHVTRLEEDGAVYYEVPDEGRSHLSFYRNNIIHLFVPEALLATAALRFGEDTLDHDALREETRFLSRLFKYEWIYEERARFEQVFERTLRYFERMGWVRWEGEVVELVGERREELKFLRRTTVAFVEAYARVADELEALAAQPAARGDVITRALKSARADFLGGKLLLAETVSKPTFLNAWRLLADWGVIEVREEAKKSDQVVWGVTEEWAGRREELREHLMALTYLGERRGGDLSLE
jgi:glycerol-3-phosphate O-acyltransferase